MTPLSIEFKDGRSVRHVLNVSGGKDSSALALLMAGRVKGLEHFRHDGMEYASSDTQKELPETYEFLARLEAELGTKIISLEFQGRFRSLAQSLRRLPAFAAEPLVHQAPQAETIRDPCRR